MVIDPKYQEYYGAETELMSLATFLHNREQEERPAYTVTELEAMSSLTVLPEITLYTKNNTSEDVTMTLTTASGNVLTTVLVAGSTTQTLMQSTYVSMTVGGHSLTIGFSDAEYSQYGLDKVELPESWTELANDWDRIVQRVNEAYYTRFIAGETLPQWQIRLQVLTDRLAPLEYAFKQYSANKTEMEESLIADQVTTYNDVTDKSDGTSYGKVSVTPDQTINDNDQYAGQTSKGTNGNTNVKSGSVSTTIVPSGGMQTAVNQNIDGYRDLETQVVDHFAKAFLSVIWY